ncbi:MAG: biopolymer transporter ExbD [Oligoflexia bacterium]|nr:biopolymer transporter ExbD [Oligoflexia bacterium]
MLKRPSSRRKSSAEGINLNLVPILDTMVTLIGFLLFTTSFLSIVHIESPFPISSEKEMEEQLKEKPLQLTVSVHESDTELWSPFEKFASKKIPHALPGQPDIAGIHSGLLEIKKLFPNETKLVLVPHAATTYDVLVSLMDSARAVEATDAPIFARNPQSGNDEAVKKLFPEIIFGNLLSAPGGDS